MRKLNTYIISSLFVGITFSGCAKSSLTYTPPFNTKKTTTTKIINKEYNKAWDELINKLTDNSFVINNIDKESGFINLSFSTQNPYSYANCGSWEGYFKNLRGESTYEFLGTENARFTTLAGTTMINVESTKSLSGRINILLQKIENKKLKIKVNVKYILNGTNKNMIPYPPQTYYENWTVSFSSLQKGQVQIGKTQCRTNGVLETTLLSYISD